MNSMAMPRALASSMTSIPNGTPGLNDGGGSGFCGLFETVFEREEGIRSKHAVLSAIARSPCGNFHRLGAAGLTGANAYRCGSLHHHDRVGFDLFAANGELHAVDLRVRGCCFVDECALCPNR